MIEIDEATIELCAPYLEKESKDAAERQTRLPQWFKAGEKLPEEKTTVLAVFKHGNLTFTDEFFYENGKWHRVDHEDREWAVLWWMPIPSFNEIIEANKDVYERLKIV